MINEHGKIVKEFAKDDELFEVFEDGFVLVTPVEGLQKKIKKNSFKRIAKHIGTVAGIVVAGTVVKVVANEMTGK